MTGDPVCATCGDRGWVADGTSHGVVCVDCADPVVLRAIADSDAVSRNMGARPSFSNGGRRRAGSAVHPRGRRRR